MIRIGWDGWFQCPATITKYLSWIFLTLLIIWEVFQFMSKVLVKEFFEYLSWQNIIELLMFSLSFAFFGVQHSKLITGEIKMTTASGRQEHLLGWALFMVWIDLTMFLGRFDLFGRHIYRSQYGIFKNQMLFLFPSKVSNHPPKRG